VTYSALQARRSSAANPLAQEALASVIKPTTYAPLRGLVMGDDGTVWVELWSADRTRRWLGLDETGKELGTVTLPQHTSLRIATRHMLWGIEGVDAGGSAIVRYRVME
jgi:hypothetical protein